MSKGRKLWDIVMPVVVFFLCNIIASIIIIIAVTVSSGAVDFLENIQAVSSKALEVTLLNFVLVIAVQSYFRKRDTVRFGKEETRWPAKWIVLGVLGVCAAGVAGNFLINISHLEEIFPYYQKISELTFQNQNPILLFAATVFIGPAAEEITFRGLVQRRARVWLTPGTAIVISALLFGLAHMNMIQLIYAFPLGLLLGLLYEKSGSLLAPVLAHMAVNAATILLF